MDQDEELFVFNKKTTTDSNLKRAKSLVGVSTTLGKPEIDNFYVTPRNAVVSLLKAEQFEGTIFEPACGNGAISEVLIEHGYNVISSDLVDRGYGITGENFFTSQIRCDNIITNPPYDLGQEFIEHALRVTTNKVAMLMKLNFLEGIKRKKMFENSPLKPVYVFSKRIKMGRNGNDYGSGMICFAWFVFDHSYSGLPYIKWI